MELTAAQSEHLATVKQQMQETFDSHRAHFEYLFPGLTLASTIGIRAEEVKEAENPPEEGEQATETDEA